MRKWEPIGFSQALTFDRMLTRAVIAQLGNRAVQKSNTVIHFARLK